MRPIPLCAVALSSLLALPALAAGTPKLTVYTYDSFVAEWGPGPQVEKAFEAVCACDLELIGVEDGAALLSRVRLEGARTEADIVLGIDTTLIEAAKATDLFVPHGLETPELTLPVDWVDETFLPYDWGYFAFVYDKTRLSEVPGSFEALIASDTSIVIQDPRSSTPGLGLLMWLKAVYGDEAAAKWAALAPQVVTVTKGWSEAYGMFLEGEADMVLSYTTSPAYHLIAEEDDSKAAAEFSDGHYMQIEVAGKLASTDQPELADQFLAFMLSAEFQSIIPTTNWMYPANLDPDALPEGFDTLITPETALHFSPQDAEAVKAAALQEWLDALSQ